MNCKFCYRPLRAATKTDICDDCHDYGMAAHVANAIVEDEDIEDKRTRALIAAEIAREYLRRRRTS